MESVDGKALVTNKDSSDEGYLAVSTQLNLVSWEALTSSIRGWLSGGADHVLTMLTYSIILELRGSLLIKV